MHGSDGVANRGGTAGHRRGVRETGRGGPSQFAQPDKQLGFGRWPPKKTKERQPGNHLLKEEQILFPYVVTLETHARDGAEQPVACFGTVRGPIQQMEHEHEIAGGLLVKLREVTGNYALPHDACPTFAALYEGLREMEADLHRHIHLENNIIFPRAIAGEH